MPRAVLFVCLGNICRSPAAEGVLRHELARRELLDNVVVDSAGTIDHHAGRPADRRMVQAARGRGIDLDSVSRPVVDSDFARFDLIVAMDAQNHADLVQHARCIGSDALETGRLRMLGSFLPDSAPGQAADAYEPVPDPYYGGEAGFHEVLDLLEAAMPALIQTLTADEAAFRAEA